MDREYAVVQSEFYPTQSPRQHGLFDTDMVLVTAKRATYTVFNGKFNNHVLEPLKAKAGERVRLYVLNAGPNGTSNFYVVGTLFDRVWLEGNPTNELHGMQTVLLGSSSGTIVEFIIPERGQYTMVDHEFADATHGALGTIDASD